MTLIQKWQVSSWNCDLWCGMWIAHKELCWRQGHSHGQKFVTISWISFSFVAKKSPEDEHQFVPSWNRAKVTWTHKRSSLHAVMKAKIDVGKMKIAEHTALFSEFYWFRTRSQLGRILGKWRRGWLQLAWDKKGKTFNFCHQEVRLAIKLCRLFKWKRQYHTSSPASFVRLGVKSQLWLNFGEHAPSVSNFCYGT